MSLAMDRKLRSTMAKNAPFEDIRTSLRDAGHIWRFQTRAEARGYARLPLLRRRQTDNRKGVRLDAQIFRRLPLSRQDLSALADSERSPAIYRWVSVENGSVVASRRLKPKDITSNSMNGICSAEFRRRYATRFHSCGCQTRAEARGYARLPLSRQDLSALADGEHSPARLPLSRQDLSALADYERSPAIYRRVSMENERLVA